MRTKLLTWKLSKNTEQSKEESAHFESPEPTPKSKKWVSSLEEVKFLKIIR